MPEPLPAEIRVDRDVLKDEALARSGKDQQADNPSAMFTDEDFPRAQDFGVVFEHGPRLRADH
ncbi:hypothetical protein GCM10027399_01560 [Curvibacter fontanus]